MPVPLSRTRNSALSATARVMSGVGSMTCVPARQITTRCARLNGGGGTPSFASAVQALQYAIAMQTTLNAQIRS
jgi:hypothetical protein